MKMEGEGNFVVDEEKTRAAVVGSILFESLSQNEKRFLRMHPEAIDHAVEYAVKEINKDYKKN